MLFFSFHICIYKVLYVVRYYSKNTSQHNFITSLIHKPNRSWHLNPVVRMGFYYIPKTNSPTHLFRLSSMVKSTTHRHYSRLWSEKLRKRSSSSFPHNPN